MSDELSSVREQLTDLGISGFFVGSGDAHQSEYVAEIDCRREFVSKFTGSAGTALVTSTAALLWTDGRYFLQATQELSSDWTLMKSGQPGVVEIDQWIVDNMPEGSIIGVDAFLISTTQAKSMTKKLSEKNITLKAVAYNPVDKTWVAFNDRGKTSRPAPPCKPVIAHSEEFAGRGYVAKVREVQEFLVSKKAHSIVFSMLDEICWLFNIRGSDIEYNPVVISYAVVTVEKAHFFVDIRKLGSLSGSYFDSSIVELHDYASIESFLGNLQANNHLVLVDPAQLNWQLYLSLGSSLSEVTSPITLKKAIKNDAEIAGIRNAHIRDGAALTAFLDWLEQNVKASPNTISECDVVDKLEEFRRKMDRHVSPSFSTISGYGPNGAIIHYKPNPASCSKLGTDSLFLLDSGAQYLDGTTDVTRTIHFGDVSQRMKDCFTYVLKGHINLARVVFPEGTAGHRLDALARLPLWTAGLDYNHGTGHGVGAFLNVHEGPQGIGSRPRMTVGEGFQAGMTTSNEPGYYEDGNFGIRVENVCVTIEAATANNFGGKKYLKFDDCTMVPIKTSLINLDLMDTHDVEWLNSYHDRVRALIEPIMQQYFPESVAYLHAETRHMSKK